MLQSTIAIELVISSEKDTGRVNLAPVTRHWSSISKGEEIEKQFSWSLKSVCSQLAMHQLQEKA